MIGVFNIMLQSPIESKRKQAKTFIKNSYEQSFTMVLKQARSFQVRRTEVRAGFLHSHIPLRGPTNRSNYHELCVPPCPFTDPSINYTHLVTLPHDGKLYWMFHKWTGHFCDIFGNEVWYCKAFLSAIVL